jgi:subtilisin family serine protease
MHHPQHHGRRRGARISSAAALAVLLLGLAASAPAWALREPPAPQTRVPAPEGLRTALKTSGIDTALVRLAGVASAKGPAAARRFAASRGLDLRNGGVRVIVVARDARAGSLALVRRAVRAAGGLVRASYGELTQAYVPVSGLKALARAGGVLDVRLPGGYSIDAVVSEGVAEMAAGVWAAAGFNGKGVKVGIIDVGFMGYQALLGTELPASVTTWGKSVLGPEGGPDDTQAHGAAVTEIVYDVAPGARLYFASVADPVELGLAEQWMVAQGVRVINHSMGWWGWAQTDGSGVVNAPVNHAVSKNVFWANSAGNSRRMHWMGDFTDPDSNNWLDFDGVAGHLYNTFYASADKWINGVLWWDDSYTAAAQDFDLHLCKYDTATGGGTIVASSMYRQRGEAGQTPIEVVRYTTPEAGYYAWTVARDLSTRTDVDFDLYSTQVHFDQPANPYPHYFMYERSFSQPADNASAGAMSVGAIERAPAFLQADYSAQGPTRDGRILPEISGPTATAGVTFPVFTGTSAASPHVAGIAAILRQAYPSYTAAQIEELIKTNAVDLGVAGPDSVFGWGRILLPAVPTDTTRPVTKASFESVKRGGYAVLPYRVNDAGFSAGPAKVTIVIKNGSGKVVKTLGPASNKPMCTALTWKFRCTLSKGTYRFFVKATDAAGLRATSIGSNRLVVK